MIEPHLHRFLVEHLQAVEIPHSGRSLFDHLKGTHDLLAQWGNPPAICHAGLMHSLYGTWHFRTQAFPIARREAIQALIGKEAEFLAYVFCVTERPKQFIALIHEPDVRIFDHHAGTELALSRETLNALLEIEAANLLEQGGRIAVLLRPLTEADVSAGAQLAMRDWLAGHE